MKLEKLDILHDSAVWLELRETRNTVTHEYPENTEEIVEGLNTLFNHYTLLLDIRRFCKEYAEKLIRTDIS